MLAVGIDEAKARSFENCRRGMRALPLVTVLTLIWLHIEDQPPAKVANHAWYTFWYALPMFLVFPALLSKMGFWPTLLTCLVITVVCFGLLTLVGPPGLR